MIKKILEPTGDVCVKFTEEELQQLKINPGDKFSLKECDGGILLEEYTTIDLDMGEWERGVLEFLIQESCEKDISVNEVLSSILESYIKHND